MTPTDTTIVAVTKVATESAEEAFADAARLRSELIAATGCGEVRGLIAAETVDDGDLNVAGWIGTVS